MTSNGIVDRKNAIENRKIPWKKKKIFHPKTQADISVIDVNVGDYNMAINDQLKYVLI